MSLMLRRGIEALVGAALVVVAMLAVLPAVAEAQSTAKPQEARDADDANPAARVVVVEPGDSLWSISAEQLGADATLAQIDRNVERIYALNRDQIGPDPNLIFPGQQLSVSAAMGSSREVAHASAKATTAPPAAREDTRTAAASGPKKTGHVVSATESETIQASRPAPRTPEAGLSARAEKAPAPLGKTPSLPKEAEAAPAVPAVRQVASEDSPTTGSPLTPFLRNVRSVVVSAASELGETLTEVRAAAVEAPRATLGWVIVVLTAMVGVLIAWKLPMKRTTRWDAERWGIPTGYYGAAAGRYPSHSGNLFVPPAKRDERGEGLPHESPAVEAPVASGPPTNNGSKANGSRSGLITRGQVKRRQLSRRAAAARGSGQSVVRRGLVSAVNSAEFHHAALRILPNRRRRHPKPPNNGGIRAAQRRRVGTKG